MLNEPVSRIKAQSGTGEQCHSLLTMTSSKLLTIHEMVKKNIIL